ncbi:hypothetical protein MHYP_G00261020 [Metynnis hypsauchen]
MTPRLLSMVVLVLVAHLALTEAAVRVWGIQASGLEGDPTGPPDPYVKVWCGSSFGGMTEFYRDTHRPSWNAEFHFSNCKANDVLKLEVWDKDLNLDDHLGTCTTQIFKENKYCYWRVLDVLHVSRCIHLHPVALRPLAHSSGLKCLTSLLALDIGFEENKDNGTATAAFLLLGLPSLRQVALDNAGQACTMVCKHEFGPTEGFTSKERVASLQELWTRRIQGGDGEEDSFSLEEKLVKSVDLGKSRADGVRSDKGSQETTVKLGICEIQSVSLDSLDAVGQLCPDLHSVSLNCHDDDDSGDDEGSGFRQTTLLTKGLATWSGQLRCLSLQFPGPLSELVTPLQVTGSSLISLTLEGVQADGHLPFLDLNSACPKLTSLTVHIDPPRSNQEEEEDDEDLNLPCLPDLRSLTLNFFLDERQLKPVLCWRSLRGPLWALLRGAPQLQKLSLIATPFRLDPVFWLVLDHNSKPLNALDQPLLRCLRHVNLKCSDVTMETMARLVNTCHRLSTLDLSGCWSMPLSNITKLQGKASRRRHKLQIIWTRNSGVTVFTNMAIYYIPCAQPQ